MRLGQNAFKKMVGVKILVVAALVSIASVAGAGLSLGGRFNFGFFGSGNSEKGPLYVVGGLGAAVKDQTSLDAKILSDVTQMGRPKTLIDAFTPFILLAKVAADTLDNVIEGCCNGFANYGLAVAKILFCISKIGVQGSESPDICDPNWGSQWEFPSYDQGYEKKDIVKVLEFFGFGKDSDYDFVDYLAEQVDDGIDSFKGSQNLLAYDMFYTYIALQNEPTWDETYFSKAIYNVGGSISVVGGGYNTTLGLDILESLFAYYKDIFEQQNIPDVTDENKDVIRSRVKNCTSETFNNFLNEP